MNFSPASPATTLHDSMDAFCEEVGIPMPEPDGQGRYTFSIEGQHLCVLTLPDGKVVLLGVIGDAGSLASAGEQSLQTLLIGCLGLQAVRFGKLGSEEVLTLDPSSDELQLWRAFHEFDLSVPGFLQAAEAMLNELEFWRNWLAKP